jgi:hypothetical protein
LRFSYVDKEIFMAASKKHLPSVRIYKVQTAPQGHPQAPNKPAPLAIPYIHLRGYWLDLAGFAPEQIVLVKVKKHRITIVPITADGL